MKIGLIKKIIGDAAYKLEKIADGLKCVESSEETIAVCCYELYDISTIQDDYIKTLLGNPDYPGLINKVCGKVASIECNVMSVSMDELHLLKNNDDAECNGAISVGVTVHSGFFKWQIRKLFGLDIDVSSETQLLGVAGKYFQFLFGNRMARIKRCYASKSGRNVEYLASEIELN